MLLDDFDYDLPHELIAQTPLKERDKSRLMVVDRQTGSISHRLFSDIIEYISPGDLLVINDTKVIPARLLGRRQTGGRLEVLLLRDLGKDDWECLVRPGHKVRVGDQIRVGTDNRWMNGTVLARTDFGGRVIHWDYEGDFDEILSEIGNVPLPPYIKEPLIDGDRYQTVYARVPGSAAAPTAGLHFTETLMKDIEGKGARFARVTLNVGLGTFRPVSVSVVEEHRMHEEFYTVGENAARAVKETRARGRHVFAVGTTVVRTLESASRDDGSIEVKSGSTDLFIYPGYRFKAVDHLITNFHLPKSTLLMLISAFAGRDLIMAAYREAVRERYRFFSFGDAMLIL